MRLLTGHVDFCQQVQLSGWAVANGGAAHIEVFVNGKRAEAKQTTITRPDVAAAVADAPELCGFAIRLQRSLRAADVLDVFACDPVFGDRIKLACDLHSLRVERLTYGISRHKPGLEIGALDRPFLDRNNFDVLFVDHASRADLISKYKHTGSAELFDPANVNDVDIVWAPGKRFAEIVSPNKFAYVCASQAIEHIADPIGWLNDLAACLEPGGRINLSVPDMRYTFDHRRSLSSAADMIDAYRRALRIPSFRQVFDHILYVAQPGTSPNFANFQNAYEVAQLAEAGTYVDAHCHVWTKDSFVECWAIIKKLDLSPLALDQAWDPIAGANEFIVSFLT